MPSLLELYGRTSKYHSYNPALYDLLKALVEAEEPEDTVRDSWWPCRNAEEGVAEAKAEWLRLAKKCDEAKAEIERLRHELSAAADCTYELRKERDEWAEKVVAQANAGTLFVVPNQEFEADAEIGKLVRNMENETGIHFSDGQYYALRFGWKARRTMGYVPIADSKSDDPAEALRAIQEVADAKV